MTDLDALERDLLAEIEAAADEAALEAVRVAALGKKGSVSELLKTLGAMTPEERKERGRRINGLQGPVSEAHRRAGARRSKEAALDGAPGGRARRRHPAGPRDGARDAAASTRSAR